LRRHATDAVAANPAPDSTHSPSSLSSPLRVVIGQELNPKALKESVMLFSGGMTQRVDDLERPGLVERVRDADDRRGTLGRLTPRELLAGLEDAEAAR
jgi:DNA-binding MarR family transcriptional regulator